MKRLTTEEFIDKARKIHGNKYDYSKVKYVNNKTQVVITCPIHGDFEQYPLNHLQGYGCKKCGTDEASKKRTISNSEFIERCKELYGDKYDYSKTEYEGSDKKIIVTCKIHGDFYVNPSHFLKGHGCTKCSKNYVPTTNEFIDELKDMFGDKYDYSEVEYKGNKKKVTLICPIHRKFYKTPNQLLRGEGCPKCAEIERIKKRKKSLDDFIKEAKEVHGDKYDYSKVEYINENTPITIICPIHGDFKQTPKLHLNGYGCKKCNSSLLENEIRTLLESNNIEFEEQKKFDWLGKQSLDFYMPKKNIAIECQGRQHYESVELFGGDEQLKRQVMLDSRKKEKCNENGVRLLYYSNKRYNDDIITNKDELLTKIMPKA